MGIDARLFRFHRRVIAGGGGPVLALSRCALSVAAVGYGLAVRVRNRLYRAGRRKVRRAEVPVISVGNITAGGTGKTPFVAWLARLLTIHKMLPAVLSRGYGRHVQLDVDDENALLGRLAKGVPVVVDANRVRGAAAAVATHGADVLVMDDGFQHRRLARDLDIVLVDAVWPFGAGRLLPRGLLREPLWGLARADIVVITRSDLVGAERLDEIKARLATLAPRTPIACCAGLVRGLRPLGAGESEGGADRLKHGRWAALCGIGNPEGFRLTLDQAGCDLAFLTVFSDHEQYGRGQIEEVLSSAAGAGCDGIVTTEKDAVKVERLVESPVTPPLYALQMDLDFTENSEALTAAILRAVRKVV